MKSDRDWAEAVIKSGDERAFRELYRKHTPRLYQFLLRILGGSHADAEDVIQETWIRAVAHLSGFRWKSALGTWLTGIALNLCRERFRRRRPHDDLGLDEVAELRTISRMPSTLLDLESAITQLPNGYRIILVLHDVEGWTHKEISRRLDISEGTSKSQLFNARRQVRRLLDSGKEVDHEGKRRIGME